MSWKQASFPMQIVLALLFVATMFSLAGSSSADDQPAAGATIVGKVQFEGSAPKRLPIDMTPNRGGSKDECSSLHPEPQLTETLVIGDQGGIANAFVYVKKGLERRKKYPLPEQPAILDQIGCMYRPRVQGVRVGQELLIRNSDKLTHNTRSYALRNRAFNIAQPADSEERSKVFKRPEKAIQMGCDLHKWMKAFVFAMDHPYFAVTDQSGEFTIGGLPPGEYTVAAWHEELGEQDGKIKVDESGKAEISFAFQAKDS